MKTRIGKTEMSLTPLAVPWRTRFAGKNRGLSLTVVIAAFFSLFWSPVSSSAPADYDRGEYQFHIKSSPRITPRDDRAFAQLWALMHDCKTNVYVENGRISSEYLRRRGHLTTNLSQNGYEVFVVDERFEGFKVTEMLLPTTWPIVAITVNSPVETVKEKLERTRGISFSRVGERRYLRKLDSSKFEIFPKKIHPTSTVIQCDSEQQ